MIIKSYKFRFYPTDEQIKQLDGEFNNARFVWNHALSLRKKAYERRGENLYQKDLSKHINQLKRLDNFKWLKSSTAACLTQKLIDLDKAYDRFFKKISRFPKFKKKNHYQSVRYQMDYKVKNVFRSGELIKITNLGVLKVKWHRKMGAGLPKMATISKNTSGQYFISLSIEIESKTLPKKTNAVGIDLGIKSVLVASNGFDSGAPKYTYKYQRELKRAQRVLSRRKKGSNRWKRQRLVVARIHQKISNSRRDFLNKLTTGLIERFGFISMEDLNVSGMMLTAPRKNRKLAKAIADVGMHEFKRQLEYKAGWYGREITIISRWFPSTQLCSSCDKRHHMPLSKRRMICDCGLNMDRDLNAAINIDKAGSALREESYQPIVV
jgi:putative transposase